MNALFQCSKKASLMKQHSLYSEIMTTEESLLMEMTEKNMSRIVTKLDYQLSKDIRIGLHLIDDSLSNKILCSVTSKKSPNVNKSCPKMIPLEK